MTLPKVLPGRLKSSSSLGPRFGLQSSVIRLGFESRDRVTQSDKVERSKPKRGPSELEITSLSGSKVGKVIHKSQGVSAIFVGAMGATARKMVTGCEKHGEA
jgi:hypothetical protein